MNSNTIEKVADALVYFRVEWGNSGYHPASIFAGYVADLTEALADLNRKVEEDGDGGALLSGVLDEMRDKRTPPGFVAQFNAMQASVHQAALDHGWWDRPREQGTTLMNIVREVSEAFDALAHGNPADKHLPELKAAVVELADTIIRIMDFAAFYDWDVAAAIVAKADYNRSRGYRHGKEF